MKRITSTNTIEGIEITANDEFLGNFETGYDTDSQVYVFNYQTSSRVRGAASMIIQPPQYCQHCDLYLHLSSERKPRRVLPPLVGDFTQLSYL